MHESTFAAAARPARYRILGLWMEPYSIGHELLLIAKSNPLLYSNFDTLDDEEKNAAIISAVLICSRNWQENKKPHRWLRLWSFSQRRADYKKAIADFLQYRAEGSTFPPTPDDEANHIANGEEKKGRELGSPYMARLLNFIGLNYDHPFGLANFLYLAHLEFEGDMKIENRKEFDIKTEMAGHRKYFAEQEEKCPRS